MRFGFTIVLAAFIALASKAPPVFADEAIHALKVDVAGRQRMLTQRIAKSGCFLATFHEVEKHRAMLRDARALFATSLNNLKYGNADLGIPAETNAVILQELNRVDQPWNILDFASGLLLESYQFPGLDVNLLQENNLQALKQSNIVVQVMDNVYSKAQTETDGLVTTVNIAGRQRMLTQKAAKEFCWIGYGLDVDESRLALQKTVALFDQSLDDLAQGSTQRGVMAAPTPEIAAKILAVKTKWQETRAVYLKIANGGWPTTEDFHTVSQHNDLLLKQSNNVVQMLVAYGKARNTNDTDG